jgi:hypothetical protein
MDNGRYFISVARLCLKEDLSAVQTQYFTPEMGAVFKLYMAC